MRTHQELLNRLREDAYAAPVWGTPSAEAVRDLDADVQILGRRLLDKFEGQLQNGRRFDAEEAAFLARQLLFVKTREANILYPELKARAFLPVSHDVPNGAKEWSVKIWDITGKAKIVANYARDFPSSNAFVREELAKIVSVGNSYSYTLQDLRASAMVPNVSIDTRRADAARMVHERRVELIAAYGDSTANVMGFVNNSTIPQATGTTGGWSTASSETILKDLHTIANFVVLNSKQIWQPDTMILPTTEYHLIATKPFSSYQPDTILDRFIRTNPYVKNVDQWLLLNASDSNAALTYNRIVCYKRDPMVLNLEIPQEFEQFPPQLEGLEYQVNCHSRVGGVQITYPLATCYASNLY